MFSNNSNTLPKGFRYHYEEPKTPEPFTEAEPRQPSPPRQRLRVRRRNASNLQAPTKQFLASVEAADIPIPTIEVAESKAISDDCEMLDREEIQTPGLLAPASRTSPPKTPVPMLLTDAATLSRPNWSMPSPDDYFNRPTSSMSNASEFSDDSFYSGSRISRPSDDGSCTSPESDTDDPFQFPSLKGKTRAGPFGEPRIILNGKLRSKTRKNAPWAKAQSAHVWSTYLVYLQDPTVTPFRIGASQVPPEGVCHRVAREARRSWKGQKIVQPRRSLRLCSRARAGDKSGSNTPTGETPKISYAAWPHSSSATRSHLRELCRNKDTAVSRHRHFQSRSPTPFTKPSRAPETRTCSFKTSDIALSLTTSTALSMQPDGPLAKLSTEASSQSSFPPVEEFRPLSFGESRGLGLSVGNRRLGSPFMARPGTYGPSSSRMTQDRPSPPRNLSDTIAGPHLRSPFQFGHSSLNGTQKRRAQNDLEEELSPNGAIVRPSILNEQLFGAPLNNRRVRLRGFSLGDEALGSHSIFSQAAPLTELFPPSQPQTTNNLTEDIQPTTSQPFLLPSAIPVPRLGSPFSESGPSQTFPRRLFSGDGNTTIRRGAFATMHQTRRSIESFDFGGGLSLQSRLEGVEMRLQAIRNKESASKLKAAFDAGDEGQSVLQGEE